MTIRTSREIATAIKAEQPLRGITYTDGEGTVWRFWAHGPYPRTAWLTDGRTFLGWDTRHARPRPDLVPQTVATWTANAAPGRPRTPNGGRKASYATCCRSTRTRG